MKTPRPHQKTAVEKTWNLLCLDEKSRPIIVVPVGGGKSYIMALLAEKTLRYVSDAKILCLSHVAELAEQTAEEIKEQIPWVSAGFYSDKLKERRIDANITLATIQSIYKKSKDFFGGFDMVFIDECHLISNKHKSMYNKFLNDLFLKNPGMRVVGLTGTDFRSMKCNLIEEENALFTDISYKVPMLQLIKEGYLCEIITPDIPLKTRLSAEGVSVRGGDYVEKQLQEAVDKDYLTEGCVREILEHAKERNKVIVFTSGVNHAQHTYDEFIRQGERSVAVVTGKTPTAERRNIIERYKFGDIKFLINVACFTTGFNNPAIDLMVIMRPMRSPVLYTQVLGRGMRTCNGKENCLLLDFGGVVDELGPIDTLDCRIGQKKKRAGSNEAPMKICPQCESVNFAGVKNCHSCDFEFHIESGPINLETEASTSAVISTQKKNKTKEFEVILAHYTKHTAIGKDKPVMKVTYMISGLKQNINDFICFEHSGPPYYRARRWFESMFPFTPAPETIDDALKFDYPLPKRIECKNDGKYYTVTKILFD